MLDEGLQRCPCCEARIDLSDQQAEIGTLLECPVCKAELVVSNDEPLELDPVFSISNQWSVNSNQLLSTDH